MRSVVEIDGGFEEAEGDNGETEESFEETKGGVEDSKRWRGVS